jgi:hypothetical protein
MRPLWLCLLLTLGETAERVAPVAPSANRERRGTYQVATTIAGYNYHVSVPAAYDGNLPAGLHVFFHGQNNQGAAKEWDRWQQPFLERFRLIGINLEYTDGDNGRDQEGKVKAAQEAIAQVSADYRVVARGAIACFSGGGAIHALMAEQYGKQRSPQWPFCHSTLYSATYPRDPTPVVPMSWCIIVGKEEWTLADLGRIAVTRTGDLYAALPKGGTPDVRFLLANKGHTITAEDVATSAACFALSDLAFGAWVHPAQVSSRELRPAVEQISRQQPAAAAATLAKLLGRAGLADDVRQGAVTLKALVDDRLDRLVATVRNLPQDDPALSAYYVPLLLAQLKGDPREKDVRAAWLAASKTREHQASLRAHEEFARQFVGLFGPGAGSPGVVGDKRVVLTAVAPYLPATSRAGAMVGELSR